jgi:uncharacterized glyoxalase superfamily protein PhnB
MMREQRSERQPTGGIVIANRSIPESVVLPELAYPDVTEAAAWLCDAFGFERRLLIGNHRAQLSVPGGGAVIVIEGPLGKADRAHSVMIRVEGVDAHHARATAQGARVLRAPADHPFGERQYTAEDPGGHVWTFSQSLADVDPASWGGILA